jgi:hypothetical protein
MTNATGIALGQKGAFELALAANTVVSLTLASYNPNDEYMVLVHSATNPVYVNGNATVTVGDQTAEVLPAVAGYKKNVRTLGGSPNETLTLISAGTAVVSVYRA